MQGALHTHTYTRTHTHSHTHTHTHTHTLSHLYPYLYIHISIPISLYRRPTTACTGTSAYARRAIYTISYPYLYLSRRAIYTISYPHLNLSIQASYYSVHGHQCLCKEGYVYRGHEDTGGCQPKKEPLVGMAGHFGLFFFSWPLDGFFFLPFWSLSPHSNSKPQNHI